MVAGIYASVFLLTVIAVCYFNTGCCAARAIFGLGSRRAVLNGTSVGMSIIAV